ncbi:hypothetical protein OsI_30273 [Oryza sativa Indica Group]|uniref:Uncharacterized protein n=1 Tax=Oryza sativa subsp. indica TaxID=39946 RepID=A2YY47_ORYSI|nr:hypothetical protein OsI_30273 [Oryza sativa Indica Group]
MDEGYMCKNPIARICVCYVSWQKNGQQLKATLMMHIIEREVLFNFYTCKDKAILVKQAKL